MEGEGWHFNLASAWLDLYQEGDKHLNKFVDMYLLFYFKLIDLLKLRVLRDFMACIITWPENVNKTMLGFYPASFNTVRTYRVSRVKIKTPPSGREQFKRNDLPRAEVVISEKQVLDVLTNTLSLSMITPNSQSSLIKEIKNALTIRLASLLQVAGLNKWPSDIKEIVFKGNESKFFSPYTHTTC